MTSFRTKSGNLQPQSTSSSRRPTTSQRLSSASTAIPAAAASTASGTSCGQLGFALVVSGIMSINTLRVRYFSIFLMVSLLYEQNNLYLGCDLHLAITCKTSRCGWVRCDISSPSVYLDAINVPEIGCAAL
ncbi:hypothetical protein BJY00DRAFT_274685 [Aspergillus carlsbadensis]|nr:hypothetical protein BJY00DRAFT_274685 [Aspergillus carlsbadensis]